MSFKLSTLIFSVVDDYRNINLNVKNLNKDVDIFAAFTNKS